MHTGRLGRGGGILGRVPVSLLLVLVRPPPALVRNGSWDLTSWPFTGAANGTRGWAEMLLLVLLDGCGNKAKAFKFHRQSSLATDHRSHRQRSR